MNELLAPGGSLEIRITSYNVCYTKLLRLKRGPVDVAVGMHDLQNPMLLSKHTNVDHVFGKDRGLYIGGCD